jgi:PKD repeat protein
MKTPTLKFHGHAASLCAVLALAMTTCHARATVLAEETFNYAAGTGLNGLNGGPGWAAAWVNTDNPWTATSPGLAVTSPEIESPDNCVKTATTSATRTATRAAVSASTPYNSGVVYLGVLLRKDSGSAEYGFVQATGDYNRNPFRIYWAHNSFWGVASQSAANTWNTTVLSTIPVVEGQAVLAVMKMDLTNKVASLYINQATEGTPDATTSTGAFGSFHSLVIRTAGGGASMDDLRLGTAYDDVVMAPPPPPPPTAPTASVAASPTNGVAPLTVTFTDTSTGSAMTNRVWNFGDGHTTNTAATTLTHTYTNGTYSVSLAVANEAGSDLLEQPDLIVVRTPFEQWQIDYFGSTLLPEAAPTTDPDGDGLDNQTEFIAGTNPTTPQAGLQFSAPAYTVAEAVGVFPTITVLRSGGSSGRVSVNYCAHIGIFDTATTPSSGLLTSGTLVWEDGDATAKTFTVVASASANTGDWTYSLVLATPSSGATLGVNRVATLTVVDAAQPAAGVLQFASPLFATVETATNAVVRVRRSGGTAGGISVNYATSSRGGGGAAAAVAGENYSTVSGTLTWADGDGAEKTFVVPILDNAVANVGNGTRNVGLNISAPTGGATLGTWAAADLYIADDESEVFDLTDRVRGAKWRVWIARELPTVRGVRLWLPGSGSDTRADFSRPGWQAAVQSWGFAFAGTTLQSLYKGAGGIGDALNIMNLIAAGTGRPEIANAPAVSSGFSLGGFHSSYFPEILPERFIAVTGHNGMSGNAGRWMIGENYTPIALPDAAKTVPGLFMTGSQDTTVTPEVVRNAWRTFRHQLGKMAYSIEWRGGHDLYDEYANQGMALDFGYMDRVIRARYPASMNPGKQPNQPVELLPIPEEDGWLAENIGDSATPGFIPIAAWSDYAGARTNACWMPDEAAARLYQAHASFTGIVGDVPHQSQPQITYPNEMQVIGPGQPITVAMSPRALANVSLVEFFDGAVKVGERSAPPWTVTLADPEPGIHGVSVVCTYNGTQRQAGFQVFTVEGPVPARVFGNGQEILNNSAVPSYADHTFFNTNSGCAVHTYTIRNFSAAPVTLTGSPLVALGGAHPGDFAVAQPSSNVVPAGGSLTFGVAFAPTAAGPRTATLSLALDDPRRSPYAFAVAGDAAGTPPLARLWLRLDETSGFVATDSSGHGNHAVVHSSANNPWRPTGGRLEGGLENDSTTLFSAPGSASLNPTNAISLALWINPTQPPTNRVGYLLRKGNRSQQYSLYFDKTQGLTFQVMSAANAGATLVYAPVFATGVWSHVTATYDRTALRLYVDGAQVASQPFAGGVINTSDDKLCIGATDNRQAYVTPRPFLGVLDNIQIYDRALTATEIASLATGATALPIGSLTALALWQADYFSVAELEDPEIGGDGADPDGDGMPNLIEYALCRHPRVSDSNDALRYPSDLDRLTMVYDRAKVATDVVVTVEVAGSLLGDWQSGPDHVTETPVEEDADTETIQAQDNTPISAAPQRFLRLTVARPDAAP